MDAKSIFNRKYSFWFYIFNNNFSKNFYFIVIFRFLQGLGSSMILASAPALIASAFESNKRGFVLGIQTTFTYIGLLLAPLLGGILTQYFGWKSLFLFNFILHL